MDTPFMPEEILRKTIVDNPWMVTTPFERQLDFLRYDCLEAMYGGAAGGGKSEALLMAAAQFLMVPGYAALILRRSFADLKLPGALIDRSAQWWKIRKDLGKYSTQDHRWYFSSGATLQFGYCESEEDINRYQSAEFQFVGIDEATQFTPRMLQFFFSRLRRKQTIHAPLRYRLATNPGGPGHAYIKDRYVTPKNTHDRVFIPAKLKDNKAIDQQQYRQSLENSDRITRLRLLGGSWDTIEGGQYLSEWFSKRWHRQGDYIHIDSTAYLWRNMLVFGTVDLAASTRTSADFTVISTWGYIDNLLVWLDMTRGKWEVPDILPKIESAYQQWHMAYVGIEGGSSQLGVLQLARRTNMAVKELKTLSQDKLVRATRSIVLSEQGRVVLPIQTAWTEIAMDELTAFTGTKDDAHDDIVDTLAYAAAQIGSRELRKSKEIKPYVVPLGNRTTQGLVATNLPTLGTRRPYRASL